MWKGEKRGVRLLDLYLSGDNHAANILSPFASNVKSKEQPMGGEGDLGGKYGEPTISKVVVYERLEPFELLNKSDRGQGQTAEGLSAQC